MVCLHLQSNKRYKARFLLLKPLELVQVKAEMWHSELGQKVGKMARHGTECHLKIRKINQFF